VCVCRMSTWPRRGNPIVDRACPECDRLWQELSSAAAAYVKIFALQKGVKGQSRRTVFGKLELRAAAAERRRARRAMERHESTHHATSACAREAIPFDADALLS